MRALLILLGIIALPVTEIALVSWLVTQFGWGPVIVAAAAFLGFGLAMLGRASRAWSQAIRTAQADPGYVKIGFGAALGGAALLLIGGLLLVIPGFLTGMVGLIFVFPPTRRLVRRLVGSRIEAAATVRGQHRITVIEGETVGRSAPDSGADRPIISGEIVGPQEGPRPPTTGDAPRRAEP